MAPNTEKTWKLITIFFLTLTIFLVSYIGREINSTRKVQVQRLSVKPMASTPSKETETALRDFVNARKWVFGVNIMRVNFQNNTREPTFGYFKIHEVQLAWDTFSKRGAVAPLFNGVEHYNVMIMNLINGEFGCHPVKDTVVGNWVPELQKYNSVCQVPIPPEGAGFTGYLNIFLTVVPSEAQILELKNAATRLSMLIYQYEVLD